MTKIHDRKWPIRPGQAGTQLHDFLWAIHDRKNHGRSEGEENIREFPVTVGGLGRAMHGGLCVSLVYAHMCEALAN